MPRPRATPARKPAKKKLPSYSEEEAENEEDLGLESMRSKVFKGLIITFTGLEQDQRNELSQMVHQLGGKTTSTLDDNVTHLVADKCDPKSNKYKAAHRMRLPVMDPSWIHTTANTEDLNALNMMTGKEMLDLYRTKLFAQCEITVSGYSGSNRIEIGRLTELHGGVFTGQMSKGSCTHLITSNNSGEKYRRAKEWGTVCVVTERWLRKSIEQEYRLSEDHFALDEEKRQSSGSNTSFLKEIQIIQQHKPTQFLSAELEHEEHEPVHHSTAVGDVLENFGLENNPRGEFIVKDPGQNESKVKRDGTKRKAAMEKERKDSVEAEAKKNGEAKKKGDVLENLAPENNPRGEFILKDPGQNESKVKREETKRNAGIEEEEHENPSRGTKTMVISRPRPIMLDQGTQTGNTEDRAVQTEDGWLDALLEAKLAERHDEPHSGEVIESGREPGDEPKNKRKRTKLS